MTDKAKKIVQNMSNSEAVRFLNYFGNALFKGTPKEIILGGVSNEIEQLTEIRKLRMLDAETRKSQLGPDDSMLLAKTLLETIASDPAMASVLVKAWDNYDSDELFVETILATGFIAGMLLFLSTTEIEGEVKGFKFKKRAASPELVKAITEPFFGAIRKLTI